MVWRTELIAGALYLNVLAMAGKGSGCVNGGISFCASSFSGTDLQEWAVSW